MTSTDLQLQGMAAMEALTGPGGAFELVDEDVLGVRTPAFAGRARALSELLEASIEHGDRDYVATLDERLSYAEHGARVRALARALQEEHGVGRGDRVGIAARNVPEWILTFWATVSIGAVAVGYNAWWSRRELEYGAGHTTPTVIVADARRAALLDDVDTPVLTLEEDLPRLLSDWSGQHPHPVAVDEDDPAVILYTSGTSGRPKGAVHTHRNLIAASDYHRLNDALIGALGDPTDPRDRAYLLTMPLFHIGSLHNLVIPRLATGSKVALHLGAFDVDRALQLVERERVTNWGAVPTMARRLLAHGDLGRYDTSSLRSFSLGSAPSSAEFKERLRTELPFAATLVDSYGLTESCTALTVATPLDLAASPGTVGRPIVGVRIDVRDGLGNPVEAGTEGEVCAHSAYNMLGYWQDQEASDAAFYPGRWLRTGDLGELDAQGRLRLSSRRSDLIIRGGENVYPAEIEGLLAEHPGVAECVVLGMAHEELGQEVAAIIVPASPEADLGRLETELRTLTETSIAYYKVPTRWRFATEPLPRNATGKVMRTRITP